MLHQRPASLVVELLIINYSLILCLHDVVLVKEEEVCSASSCQDSAPKISLSELDRIMRGRDPSNPLLSEEGSPILFDTALLELPHPASGHQSSFSSLVDNATTSGSLYCCPQGMYTLKDCLTRSGKITTIMGLIIEGICDIL